jgi:hypothetical protein
MYSITINNHQPSSTTTKTTTKKTKRYKIRKIRPKYCIEIRSAFSYKNKKRWNFHLFIEHYTNAQVQVQVQLCRFIFA